jgi:hypothetical protein
VRVTRPSGGPQSNDPRPSPPPMLATDLRDENRTDFVDRHNNVTVRKHKTSISPKKKLKRAAHARRSLTTLTSENRYEARAMQSSQFAVSRRGGGAGGGGSRALVDGSVQRIVQRIAKFSNRFTGPTPAQCFEPTV